MAVALPPCIPWMQKAEDWLIRGLGAVLPSVRAHLLPLWHHQLETCVQNVSFWERVFQIPTIMAYAILPWKGTFQGCE